MSTFAAYGGRASRSVRSGGNRRALCIGINRYRSKPLQGCVKDATDWADWFRDQGFTTSVLLDGDATASRMLNSMRQLIRDSRSGDVVAIQYSGHGTTASKSSGDERVDEALVPIDYRPGRLIIDDDLAKICDTIPPGVNVTFFMDCCHSGTNTRLFVGTERHESADEVARFMPLEEDTLCAHWRIRSALRSRRSRSPYENRPEILFAACMANQKSLEPRSGGNGFFTARALRVLRRGISGLSNGEFIDRVRQEFGSLLSRQHPELWSDRGYWDQGLLAPRASAVDSAGGGNELDELIAMMHGAQAGASAEAPDTADSLDALLAEMQEALRRIRTLQSH